MLALVITFSHLWIYFFGKHMKEKRQLVQDLTLLSSYYILMCTSYTGIYDSDTYMLRFSPFGFFVISRCLVPIPGLTVVSEYPTCSACVCVCMITDTQCITHTCTPNTVKSSETWNDTDNTWYDTDNTSILPVRVRPMLLNGLFTKAVLLASKQAYFFEKEAALLQLLAESRTYPISSSGDRWRF